MKENLRKINENKLSYNCKFRLTFKDMKYQLSIFQKSLHFILLFCQIYSFSHAFA